MDIIDIVIVPDTQSLFSPTVVQSFSSFGRINPIRIHALDNLFSCQLSIVGGHTRSASSVDVSFVSGLG